MSCPRESTAPVQPQTVPAGELMLSASQSESRAAPSRGACAESPAHAASDEALASSGSDDPIADLRGEIAELTRRLAGVDREREEFLAVLGHELFTPLAVIKGYTRMLLCEDAGALSPEQRRYLEVSGNSCERLDEFINDLLDVTPGAHRGRSLEDVSLEDAVDVIVTSLYPLLAERGLQIATEIARDLPELRCDRGGVERVITNLLANAIKFTKPDSRIDVEVHVIHDAGVEQIAIDVIDDGPGIRDADRERIFAPYVRASSETLASGIGLGLAICRRIATAHRGTIGAMAEPGRGSRFRFAIPTAGSRKGAQLGLFPNDEQEPGDLDG